MAAAENTVIAHQKLNCPSCALCGKVKEAKRVTSKIPEMEPGKQRGVPVSVIYQLPIKFRVQD